MRYRIYPLFTGYFTVLFNTGERVKFPRVNDVPTFIFLFVDENGETIIVDTGFDVDYIPGEFSHGIRGPEQQIPFLVKQAGFNPADVKKIVMTHLHWDHGAGIKHFPNAEIYVQEGEIAGLMNLKENEETSFCPVHWIDRLDSFILVDGNREILPGIEVIRTGTHTGGHQAIKVQGIDNNFLFIGDSPFSYEWLWTLIPADKWKEYREGPGRKFFWKDQFLDRIGKWYLNRKTLSPQPLKIYTMNDLKQIEGKQVFSHDPELMGRVSL